MVLVFMGLCVRVCCAERNIRFLDGVVGCDSGCVHDPVIINRTTVLVLRFVVIVVFVNILFVWPFLLRWQNAHVYVYIFMYMCKSNCNCTCVYV